LLDSHDDFWDDSDVHRRTQEILGSRNFYFYSTDGLQGTGKDVLHIDN